MNILHMRIYRIHVKCRVFFLLLALFNVAIINFQFVKFATNFEQSYLFGLSVFTLTTLIYNLFFNIFLGSRKKLLCFFTLTTNINAVVLYFAKYKISIHPDIIRTVFATDAQETTSVFDFKSLLYYFTIYSILPHIVFFYLKIEFTENAKLFEVLKEKIKQLGLTILLSCILIFSSFNKYVHFSYSTGGVVYSITPINYIYSLLTVIKEEVLNAHSNNHATSKVRLSKFWNQNKEKNIFVLIIGESARAMNFELSGYHKHTNPKLKKRDIVYFSNVRSCGNSTVRSLPCSLSYKKESEFDHSFSADSIISIAQRLNFDLLWVENNTHNNYKIFQKTKDNFIFLSEPECRSSRCHDELMIPKMLDRINKSKSNKILIVLRQYGSHGPDYFNRYPKEFEVFKPTCKNTELQQCSNSEIENTYDNSILYTDHFIDRAIKELENLPQVNSFLIYYSDHGECLGEDGYYMHGFSEESLYKYQRHVPMLMWMSKSFEQNFKIDKHCLLGKKNNNYSHDNIFHSLYNVMGFERSEKNIYKEDLDIFKECRADYDNK